MDDFRFKETQRKVHQLEAIDKIEKLFLDIKIVTLYSNDEDRKRQNQERLLQAKTQFFELIKIIEEYELDNEDFLIRLFETLQLKAENKISALTILPQTIDPSFLENQGIEPQLIEATKRTHDFFYKKAKTPYLEGNQRGGSKRSELQQKNYDEHKDWWNKWQRSPNLYTNVTAYDESMRDKTGAGLTTIRKHRKEFEGKLKPNTIGK